jgi:hypothetical protein
MKDVEDNNQCIVVTLLKSDLTMIFYVWTPFPSAHGELGFSKTLKYREVKRSTHREAF